MTPIPTFAYDSGIWVEFQGKKEDLSGKGSEKSSVKGSGKILELMEENPNITIPVLAESLKISTRAVEKQINNLKKNNQLQRVGGRKEGYWQVVKK